MNTLFIDKMPEYFEGREIFQETKIPQMLILSNYVPYPRTRNNEKKNYIKEIFKKWF